MVSFTSRPLYSRDRTAVPIQQEMERTQSWSGRMEKRKVFCPRRESSPDHPASSLVTVPAYRSFMQLSTGSSHSFPCCASCSSPQAPHTHFPALLHAALHRLLTLISLLCPDTKTPSSQTQRTHVVEQNGFPLPRLPHLNDQISTSYVFRTIETFLILPPLPTITMPSFTLP